MAESIVNNGSSSIEFTAADISVSNFPILEEKSKNVGWDQSIVDSKHKTCCNEVDVPNQASNIINSTGDHDSHTDYFTAKSKENPNTRPKQQAEFSSKVSNKSEFSFDLGILLAEIDQVPMPQCDKQDADHHNSIPHGQTMNTKAKQCFKNKSTPQPPKDAEGERIGSFLSSDLEPKESVNTSTEQKKEKVSIHAEVAALLSSNTRIEDSDRSPLPYNQEQTVEKDVFELKSFRNATLSSKVGVNAAGADSKLINLQL
ncbi:hypothetical protein Sjap_008085 [Stephania japonica]|uniref:Uncharacterized protein n=1 Tax=Stephania japonica TaxID=461633 RepID=A0AAP0JPP5_9MAGN